jgi:hypothetical protein
VLKRRCIETVANGTYRLRDHESLVVVVEVPDGYPCHHNAKLSTLISQLIVVDIQSLKATVRLQRKGIHVTFSAGTCSASIIVGI